MRVRFVFLGTGCSAGCPLLRCVLQNPGKCVPCTEAAADPQSVYARGPPSLLVQTLETDDAVPSGNLLIDCGPDFKSRAVRFFGGLGVRGVDAVLLTHDHFDAVAGLNDLRELQSVALPPGVWTIEEHLPVYASDRTLATCRAMFPYLFAQAEYKTLTGKLEGRPFDPEDPTPLDLPVKLQVQPLAVTHGEGYTCSAFLLARQVAYLSDVSAIPEATMQQLQAANVRVLVIDAISPAPRPSHFSLEQALEAVRAIKPSEQVYFVGMSCSLDHHEVNAQLVKMQDLPCPAQLAYDGLSFELQL